MTNRIIYSDGKVQLTLNGVIDALNSGADITSLDVLDERDVSLYNKYAAEFGLPDVLPPKPVNHQHNQNAWFFPEQYRELDLYAYFDGKCKTEIELTRVHEELSLYELGQLTDLLRCAIWFVDTMSTHNVFWGVGRGSSVSSYCLFLIGLHLVDSIKYNLDIKDFIKIKKEVIE